MAKSFVRNLGTKTKIISMGTKVRVTRPNMEDGFVSPKTANDPAVRQLDITIAPEPVPALTPKRFPVVPPVDELPPAEGDDIEEEESEDEEDPTTEPKAKRKYTKKK